MFFLHHDRLWAAVVGSTSKTNSKASFLQHQNWIIFEVHNAALQEDA